MPSFPLTGGSISQITVSFSIGTSQFRLLKSTIPCAFSIKWGEPMVRGKRSITFPSTPGTGATPLATGSKVKHPSAEASLSISSFIRPYVIPLASNTFWIASSEMGSPPPSAGKTIHHASLQLGAVSTTASPAIGGGASKAVISAVGIAASSNGAASAPVPAPCSAFTRASSFAFSSWARYFSIISRFCLTSLSCFLT